MEEMNETIIGMKDEIDDLKNLLRILKLSVTRYHKNTIKKVEKLEGKLKRKKLKSPSGFAKPTEISEELCMFMNKPMGSKIPRTEVTRFLIDYIKENNLQDQDKKSNIHPDEKLKPPEEYMPLILKTWEKRKIKPSIRFKI